MLLCGLTKKWFKLLWIQIIKVGPNLAQLMNTGLLTHTLIDDFSTYAKIIQISLKTFTDESSVCSKH